MTDGDMAQLRRLLSEINDALSDNAGRFTCTEAEAIYELYELAGMEADWFMRAHAHEDDPREEDMHMETDNEKGWAYR